MTKKEKKVFDEWVNELECLERVKKRSLKDLNAIFDNDIKKSKPTNEYETLKEIFNSDIDERAKSWAVRYVMCCKEMEEMIAEREDLKKRIQGVTTA